MTREELRDKLNDFYSFAFAYVREQPDLSSGGLLMSGFAMPLAMELDKIGHDGRSVYRLAVMIEEDYHGTPVSKAELRVALMMAFYELVQFEPNHFQAPRPSVNDDRDAYIYQERMKKPPTPYAAIRKVIKNTQGWGNLSNDQGARQAVDRYAKRHGKPEVPKEG